MLSTIVRSLVCAVTLLALTAAPAAAQIPIDKRVDFTFNVPITVPGATLPPGTYQFRLANPFGARNVVHVFDRDGMKLYATFLTMPVELVTAPEEPEVRMLERRAGAPHAIRAWWYPSIRTGFQPVYPREQAEQVARNINESVPTSRATAAALMEANGLSRVSGASEKIIAQ